MTLPIYNYSDRGDSWLSDDIGASNTALTVASGGNFSNSNFIIMIQAEKILVATRSGASFSSMTRGVDGTSAITHLATERVFERLSQFYFTHLQDSILTLGTTTPINVSASAVAGTSASVSRSDHTHFGVTIGGGGSFTLNFNNNPILAGQATLVQGAGASLSQSGGSITIGSTAGGGSFTLNLNNNPILTGQATLMQGAGASISQSGASITIGASNAGLALGTVTPAAITGSGLAGTSASAAPSDHVHAGVVSVTISGNPNQSGVISLLQGTGTSLNQSGGSITIGASNIGLALATTTPVDISSSALAGTSASADHSDHVHRGVLSFSVPTMAAMFGGIALVQGTGASLSQSGASITIGGSTIGGGLALDATGIVDIASTAVVGTSASATHGDHTHRGVLSISVPTMANMYGGVALVQGTGASLSQSGASITIGATGGAADLALTWRLPTGTETITAGYSAYVVGDYEIANGFVLDILANAVMEIG